MRVINGSQPSPRGRGQQLVPSSMEVTNAQLGNLLIVSQSLMPYLITASGVEVDKEVADSASATFMKVCDRIDEIIDDKKRWSTEGTDALTIALQRVYDTQAELNVASEQGVIQAQRPSFLLRVDLTERKPGEWVAQYGKGQKALRGVGATPNEAMLAFDLAFYALANGGNQNGQ